jgi:hypothetical protein
MAEIINLKRVRKAAARQQKERDAESNRIKFGQSKASRAASKALHNLDTKRLDGHKRDA